MVSLFDAPYALKLSLVVVSCQFEGFLSVFLYTSAGVYISVSLWLMCSCTVYSIYIDDDTDKN